MSFATVLSTFANITHFHFIVVIPRAVTSMPICLKQGLVNQTCQGNHTTMIMYHWFQFMFIIPSHMSSGSTIEHATQRDRAFAVFNQYYYWGQYLPQSEYPSIAVVDKSLFKDVREWIIDARIDHRPCTRRV